MWVQITWYEKNDLYCRLQIQHCVLTENQVMNIFVVYQYNCIQNKNLLHKKAKMNKQICCFSNSYLFFLYAKKKSLRNQWKQYNRVVEAKIQQTKMLVTCQRFGDLLLFGLVWQYSSIQKNIIKVGSKSWILTCS